MGSGPTGRLALAESKSSELLISKRNLLDDSDSDSDSSSSSTSHPDSDSDSGDDGVQISETGFEINQEYAKRFEHNKKREERQKLEEKYKNEGKGRQDDENSADEFDESSSSNETEDEDGFLATEDLDAQISATLQAIRNKDPRLYDKDYNFIDMPEDDDDDGHATKRPSKDRPVFLRDYQRERLLSGAAGGFDDDDSVAAPQKSYAQEQDALKHSIISEINAAKGGESTDESDDEDFLKKKASTIKVDGNQNGVHVSRAGGVRISELDIDNAEKDPETYLSNFLASRAWIPEEGGKWKAFESDEGEDDDRADEFEQAYNMRFEDPEKSNEILKSYARDFAAARSVRREEQTSRQRQRELEKERKKDDKRQRREEKARLRKLKLEETEVKLRKIKQAAGAAGRELTQAEWMAFLDEAWDNEKWEEEMKKRFGDEYYAMKELECGRDGDGQEEGKGKNGGGGGGDDDDDDDDRKKRTKKRQPKKPRWDDDIDIKDLVPDFEDEDKGMLDILSDDDDEDASPQRKRKSSDHKRARLASQRQARQDRSKVESLVDSKLELTNHHLLKSDSGFRYRETSPQSFGMTARDILLAPSDKALNEFFGLKKLASFRDVDKKRRDKKRLGKKARLREWRRGTFGKEFEGQGPTYGFEALMDEAKGGSVLKDGAPVHSKHGDAGDKLGLGEMITGRKGKRKRPRGEQK